MTESARNLRQRSVPSMLSPMQGNKWTNDEHLQLVAWMAHCQRRDASGSLFRKTVLNHLEGQFHKAFSFLQVDEKIKRMWKEFVAKKGKNYAQLNMSHTTLYEGHTAISFTQHLVKGREKYKDVQRRILELEHERDSLSCKARTSRSMLPGISPIARLRQRDMSASTTEDQRKRANNKRAQRRQRRRHRARSEIPQTPSSLEDGTRSGFSPDLGPPDRASRSPLTSCLSESDTCPLDFGLPPLEHEDSAENSLLDIGKRNANAGMVQANPGAIRTHDRQQPAGLDCLHLHRQIASLEKDIQYHRKELLKAKERANDLERQRFASENTQGILARQDLDFTRTMLEDYQMRIQDLTSKLQRRAKLERVVKFAGTAATESDRTKLTDHMSSMTNLLERVMCHAVNEKVDLSQVCSSVECSELQALMDRILRQNDGECRIVSYHYVVRSLISAALCAWVFEIEWREQCMSSSLLMDTLVSHIITQDEENIAQALLFAANQTVIESAYFQDEVIPRRAEELTLRLLDALDPAKLLREPDASNCGILQGQWQQEKDPLQNIFIEALKVKALALISSNIFEVEFPQAGERCSPKVTQVEHYVHSPGTKSNSATERFVFLPLAPGLRSYAHDRKVVDYNSFRHASGFHDEDAQIMRPLILEERCAVGT